MYFPLTVCKSKEMFYTIFHGKDYVYLIINSHLFAKPSKFAGLQLFYAFSNLLHDFSFIKHKYVKEGNILFIIFPVYFQVAKRPLL